MSYVFILTGHTNLVEPAIELAYKIKDSSSGLSSLNRASHFNFAQHTQVTLTITPNYKIMNTIKYLLSITLVISFFSFIGCKKKSVTAAPNVLSVRLTELMNGGSDWSLLSATKDNNDVSGQYVGLTLTIGEYTYSTQNGLVSAWSASGTWEFSNNDPNKVLRSDGTLIYVALSGTQLTLSFSVSGLSGGRLESIDGDYVFVLSGK